MLRTSIKFSSRRNSITLAAWWPFLTTNRPFGTLRKPLQEYHWSKRDSKAVGWSWSRTSKNCPSFAARELNSLKTSSNQWTKMSNVRLSPSSETSWKSRQTTPSHLTKTSNCFPASIITTATFSQHQLVRAKAFCTAPKTINRWSDLAETWPSLSPVALMTTTTKRTTDCWNKMTTI